MICKSIIHNILGSIASKAKRLDVTTQMPRSVAEIESLCVGYSLNPKISGIKDMKTGAEIEIGPIEDGVVMKVGKPLFWVLSSGDEILASGDLESSKPLRPGVAWVMGSVKIQATT